MSQSRHDDIAVRTLAVRYSAGVELDSHAHRWHQVVYAGSGVMHVSTERGRWVVPPQRAAWVPAGVQHALTMTGPVDLRTVYLRPDIVAGQRDACVLNVTPFVRELVLYVVSLGMLRDSNAQQARLAGVLVDQVLALDAAPFWLPMPTDPRARRVADALLGNPASRDAIDVLARRSGASPRTLERVFQSETGLSFGRWRQQLRLLHATERLGRGEAVTSVALEVGYESPSAFIAAFRSALGVTPGKYFASP